MRPAIDGAQRIKDARNISAWRLISQGWHALDDCAVWWHLWGVAFHLCSQLHQRQRTEAYVCTTQATALNIWQKINTGLPTYKAAGLPALRSQD